MEKKKVIELSVYVPTINGVWWNKDRGLITIVNEGQAVFTVADKDLGAPDVYDGTEGTGVGKLYQWGNQYGFDVDGPVTTYGDSYLGGPDYNSNVWGFSYGTESPFSWWGEEPDWLGDYGIITYANYNSLKGLSTSFGIPFRDMLKMHVVRGKTETLGISDGTHWMGATAAARNYASYITYDDFAHSLQKPYGLFIRPIKKIPVMPEGEGWEQIY